jgi:outer membrane protein assembly factor BamB
VVSTAGQDFPGEGDDRWRMAAYETRSGRHLWTYEPPRAPRSRIEAVTLGLTTPYVSAERVYARVETSDGATLLVLDAATGQQAWTADRLAFGHYSRHTDVAALNGRVLIPTRYGDVLELHALRESDGSELWSVRLGEIDFPRSDLGPFLAASPDTFYVGLASGVIAFDAATGAERFRIAALPSENGGQIALADRLLYRRTGLQTIVAYDRTTGEERWTYHQPFGEWGGALRSFAVRDHVLAVYCACDTVSQHRSGWLLAVEAATGAERWRAPMDAYIDLYQDQPAIGGGMVLAGSEDDDVVARAMIDGAERWRLPRERGQFVASDGRLVYATDRAPRWQHWLTMLGISR